MYDDYIEHESGALQALEDYLRTFAYRSKAAGDSQAHQPGSSPHLSIAPRQVLNSGSSQTIASGSGDKTYEMLQTNSKDGMDLEQGEEKATLHLMCTMVKGRFADKLHQESVTQVSTDQELFWALRKTYHEHRGKWKRLLSLSVIESIEFMKVRQANTTVQ